MLSSLRATSDQPIFSSGSCCSSQSISGGNMWRNLDATIKAVITVYNSPEDFVRSNALGMLNNGRSVNSKSLAIECGLVDSLYDTSEIITCDEEMSNVSIDALMPSSSQPSSSLESSPVYNSYHEDTNTSLCSSSSDLESYISAQSSLGSTLIVVGEDCVDGAYSHLARNGSNDCLAGSLNSDCSVITPSVDHAGRPSTCLSSTEPTATAGSVSSLNSVSSENILNPLSSDNIPQDSPSSSNNITHDTPSLSNNITHDTSLSSNNITHGSPSVAPMSISQVVDCAHESSNSSFTLPMLQSRTSFSTKTNDPLAMQESVKTPSGIDLLHESNKNIVTENVPKLALNKTGASNITMSAFVRQGEFLNVCLSLVEMEHEILEKSRICSACYVKPRDITFLPCGHFITCRACAEPIYNCPQCNTSILATIDTYLS